MGHHINALIGCREALAPLISRLGSPDPTELDFQLLLVPLDEQRLDELAVSAEEPFAGFTYLTPRLAEALARANETRRFLYIETEYFGGMGGQGAALFEGGAMVWRCSESTEASMNQRPWFAPAFATPPASPSKSPISQGLEMIGVIAAAGRDEFDRLDLVRFRSFRELGIEYHD